VFVACAGHRRIARVLVAYDGSPEATRALRVAGEMNDRGRARLGYILLTVGEDGPATAEIQRTALTYFQAHGIVPEAAVRAGRPGQAIVAAARELGCDLVVAGSFGQARWREMLLGSVTLDLLRHSPVPVLIHH
jgi:nucleotide-binding universal stress UspA family protein